MLASFLEMLRKPIDVPLRRHLAAALPSSGGHLAQAAFTLACLPLVFVLGSVGLLAGAIRSRTARRLLVAEWLLYGALGAFFAARGARGRDEPWTLMPAVLAAFPTIHLGFGSGQAVGLARALWRRRR